jgi:hypothetical protein
MFKHQFEGDVFEERYSVARITVDRRFFSALVMERHLREQIV